MNPAPLLVDDLAKFAERATPMLVALRLSKRSMADLIALIPDKSGIPDNIPHAWGVRLEPASEYLPDEYAQLLFSDKTWKIIRIR